MCISHGQINEGMNVRVIFVGMRGFCMFRIQQVC